MVRRVSTVRRRKRAPGNKSVWASHLGMEAYLCGCKSQPNILPLTPRLRANKNKHLPHRVQNEDATFERRVGGGGDMRELGRLSLVSATIYGTYPLVGRSRDLPDLRVVHVYTSPPCPVRCIGVFPITVAEDCPKNLVFIVLALVKDNYAASITTEAGGVVKSRFLFFRPRPSSVPHVEHLKYAQTIQAITEARA